MRKLSALTAVVATAALLGACVPLHSTEPIYAESAGEGAPGLRQGVWTAALVGADAPCDVDTAAPIGEWPSCASLLVVDGDRYLQFVNLGEALPIGEPGERPGAEWDISTFVLAAGEPRVMQNHDTSGPKPVWYYSLVTPSATADGEITGFEMVSQYCYIDIFSQLEGFDLESEESLEALDDIDLLSAEGAEACAVADQAALVKELANVAKAPKEFDPSAFMGDDEPEPGTKMVIALRAEWVRPVKPQDELPK